MSKVTIKNIRQYLEGNAKFYLDKLNQLPKYYKEQVVWRTSKCVDTCMIKNENKCEYCGCEASKKIYVEESCNDGKVFPNLMTKEEWDEYKEKNDIKVYL